MLGGVWPMVCRRTRSLFGETRVRSPHRDPLAEIGDHLVRQLPVGRHLVGFVTKGFEQETSLRLSRDDDRPAIATSQQGFAAIQLQTAAETLGIDRMARIAMLDQHRSDAFLKKLQGLRGRRFYRSAYPGAAKKHQPCEKKIEARSRGYWTADAIAMRGEGTGHGEDRAARREGEAPSSAWQRRG